MYMTSTCFCVHRKDSSGSLAFVIVTIGICIFLKKKMKTDREWKERISKKGEVDVISILK